MKIVKRLLIVVWALVSAGSIAVVQPIKPVGEDSPIRIHGGLQGGYNGVMKAANTDKMGFGFSNVGLGLGFAHNVGYDFEYGLSISGDWATAPGNTSNKGRGTALWSKDATDAKTAGARTNIDLMVRYMPELSERFNAGLAFVGGWGDQFGESNKAIKDARNFGDLNLKVGPAMSYGFGDTFSAYMGVSYTMSDIRFLKEGSAGDALKAYSSLHGLEAPVGLWFSLADNAGLFLEVNTRFRNISEFTKSWREEATLGLTFAI